MNLQTQRQRAANAIRDRILCWGDPPAPQSDRLVDGWARALLELPAGPEGDKPYVGWLPETSGAKSAAATDAIGSPWDAPTDWDHPNSHLSKYFTVKEVTQGDRRLIPQKDSSEEKKIFILAEFLDKVQADWGRPMGVTSWYRRPGMNAAVGGAEDSQYLPGKAADIYTLEGSPREFEPCLDEQAWSDRALGYGVASGKGFTHLDLRKGRIRWWC